MKTEVKKFIVMLSICFGFTCVNGMMLWMGNNGWIAGNMFDKYVQQDMGIINPPILLQKICLFLIISTAYVNVILAMWRQIIIKTVSI